MAYEFFWLNEKYGMEEICWWYRKSMELPSSSRKGQIHHYTKGSLWNHIYKLGRALLDWALSLLKSIIRSWEKFLSKNQAPETFLSFSEKNLGGQEFSSHTWHWNISDSENKTSCRGHFTCSRGHCIVEIYFWFIVQTMTQTQQKALEAIDACTVSLLSKARWL